MFKQTLENKKKDRKLLIELKGIDKFFDDLKTSIFNVLFVLLKDEDENMLLLYSGVAVDYAQMHYFPFNDKIAHVWNATKFLENIFTLFRVFDFAKFNIIKIKILSLIANKISI